MIIKGFFDNVDHDWMMKFIDHRIKDPNMQRLIMRFLRAGIMEAGIKYDTPQGTHQGGVISPILANIYVHYVLDFWFKQVIMKQSMGEAFICRYADDFVCIFRYKKDAGRFYHKIQERLEKFNLELAMEKTNIMLFSRYKKNQSGSFEFLGFEIRWEQSRKGKDIIKKRTSRKKLRKSINNFTLWCKKMRNKRFKTLFEKLNSKLRGYYNYYGVINNYDSLEEFFEKSLDILYK